MTDQRRPKERPDAHPDEPIDAEELAGESQYSLEGAGATPYEREERRRLEEAEGGPPADEPLVESPEELGRHFLEGATQQPRSSEGERDEAEREGTGEEPLPTVGEQEIRDQAADAAASADRLVTHRPDRTEREERISRETRERQKREPLEERNESRQP